MPTLPHPLLPPGYGWGPQRAWAVRAGVSLGTEQAREGHGVGGNGRHT